jgi:predicted nucleic acid-binding protein
MTNPIIIDTDVLIDVGRYISEATTCLSEIRQKGVPAISSITYMELMVGCRNKKELSELDRFISQFRIIPLNSRISDIASNLLYSYRLSHGLLIPDSLI